MNKDRVLVALVVADILLAFSIIGAELMFQWTLPAPLREYAVGRAWSPSNVWAAGGLMVWATTVSCTVVAWIGLLNYWRLARPLYLVAWGTWVLLALISGPSVLTPVGAMFDMLSSIVGGVIIGLVYFSDLARSFEKPREVRIAGPAGRVRGDPELSSPASFITRTGS